MKDSIELLANGQNKSLEMLADVSDAVGVIGVVLLERANGPARMASHSKTSFRGV